MNLSKKSVLWRHDIDFSLGMAEKIARIESNEGVKSTYFILLHGEFYNLLEKESSEVLLRIIKLGHDIGLHFDTHYYKITNRSNLVEYLLFEKAILEKIFKVQIKSFAFHITDDLTRSFHERTYGSLINVYSKYLREICDYCSDSNGYWRFRRLEDVLVEAKAKYLHVLTHPAFWQEKIISPKQRLWNVIKERSNRTKNWYKHMTITYGRKYF